MSVRRWISGTVVAIVVALTAVGCGKGAPSEVSFEPRSHVHRDPDPTTTGTAGTAGTAGTSPTTPPTGERDGAGQARGGGEEQTDGGIESAPATARAWIEALGRGDMQRAWELTAPESRRAIGGYDRFRAERAALGEGWGAWASARDAVYTVGVIPPQPVGVVTITGTVTQEGSTRARAAALPVRIQGAHSTVSPFEAAPSIELRSPTEASPSIAPSGSIQVALGGGDHAWFRVDTGDYQRAVTKVVEGTTVALRAVSDLGPGEHTLSVASIGPDGAVRATATRFTVVAPPTPYEGIWPEWTGEELAATEAAVAEGHQPWRLDAVEVARAYLKHLGLDATSLEVHADLGASVSYTASKAKGTVVLHRRGPQSPWFVVSSRAAGWRVDKLQRAGGDVSFDVVSEVTGIVSASFVHGDTAEYAGGRVVEAATPAAFSVAAPGAGPLLLRLRHTAEPDATSSLSELRVPAQV